jgi:hypothetical protein
MALASPSARNTCSSLSASAAKTTDAFSPSARLIAACLSPSDPFYIGYVRIFCGSKVIHN